MQFGWADDMRAVLKIRVRRYALAASLASAAPCLAAEATRSDAGALPDGRRVEAVTLSDSRGYAATILAYGATLQRLIAPDCRGRKADVVLGYDDLQSYVQHPNYFGATIGRYANRIAGARFTLDGKNYDLQHNEPHASLHGGTTGFDKLLWRVAAVASGPEASVTFTRTSPDGEAGYPGKLDVSVTFALDDSGSLRITYDASTDKPTIVNMTNHALFALAGEGAPDGALGETLTIPAAHYTLVDADLIPTGELRAVAGTVFDFRTPRRLADGVRDGRDAQIRLGHGYDHNFALDHGLTAAPQLDARLQDSASGRVLEVLSDQPGLQVYTGNFLDAKLVGKAGHLYRMGDGIALEPQKFPDAPHHPAFDSARVDPGKPYHHVMIYRLSTQCGAK